ncbi:MAG: hypothetical protein GX644_05835, partial [Limnobacter sp.]|nr:hypothetical protein [Limnobacter sp.]
RAQQVTGDTWAEDPACYLEDEEIGVRPEDYGAERVVTTPWVRVSRFERLAAEQAAAKLTAEGGR